jgi:hypothetical protein
MNAGFDRAPGIAEQTPTLSGSNWVEQLELKASGLVLKTESLDTDPGLGRLNRPICLDHFLDLPNSVQNPVSIGNIRGFSGSKNQATNSAQKWRF